MVQITLKSTKAMEELLSIAKENVTLTVSDEVAAEFFELAMKKRLLQEVEFGNTEKSSKDKSQKETLKTSKGMTEAIKRIFEENPSEELTRKDIREKMPSEFDIRNLSSILKGLGQSGYLQINSSGEVKKYKKAK